MKTRHTTSIFIMLMLLTLLLSACASPMIEEESPLSTTPTVASTVTPTPTTGGSASGPCSYVTNEEMSAIIGYHVTGSNTPTSTNQDPNKCDYTNDSGYRPILFYAITPGSGHFQNELKTQSSNPSCAVQMNFGDAALYCTPGGKPIFHVLKHDTYFWIIIDDPSHPASHWKEKEKLILQKAMSRVS